MHNSNKIKQYDVLEYLEYLLNLNLTGERWLLDLFERSKLNCSSYTRNIIFYPELRKSFCYGFDKHIFSKKYMPK